MPGEVVVAAWGWCGGGEGDDGSHGDPSCQKDWRFCPLSTPEDLPII